MKRIKKIFTAIISMVLVIAMVGTSYAFATSEQDMKTGSEKLFMSLSTEQIKDALTEISEMFPEARINVEADLEFARQHSDMSEREQIEYLCNLMEAGPREVYKHVEEDGSYAILNVYGPLAYQSYGVTIGSITQSGDLDIYTGTRVWVNNLGLSLGANARYDVNHTYANQYSSGWINSVYSVYHYGGFPLVIGNSYNNSTGGSYSDVWFRMYDIDIEGNYPTYRETFSLKFDATYLNASLTVFYESGM